MFPMAGGRGVATGAPSLPCPLPVADTARGRYASDQALANRLGAAGVGGCVGGGGQTRQMEERTRGGGGVKMGALTRVSPLPLAGAGDTTRGEAAVATSSWPGYWG